MTLRVGWVGLGKLGAPMARHVAAAYPMRALDRDPARFDEVPRADRASSLAALASWADVVVLSLPDDGALLAVATEVAPHMRHGAALVDTSTVSPDACDRVRALVPEYLAAPVSGSTATAEAAKLSAFCSGPESAMEHARPVLARFAPTVVHLGPGAEARFMKLAVNHFVATTAQVAAEALALARKGGVGWEQALDVLGASVAASPLLAYKLGPLRARDFAPAFSVSQMVKDSGLVADAAVQAGTPARLAALVHEAYVRQAASGLAGLDFFAAILEAEREAGLEHPLMHWIIHCRDREGALPTRLAHYDAHKAYLGGALPVRILVSGPLVAGDNETAVGSFFLVEAPDRAAVDSFHAADPFRAAEIWAEVRIDPFLKRQDNR